MRTKALLSVAAIAASAITAMAQGNVYSLNIVGYATVPVQPGYNLLANPLDAGSTNGAGTIMPILDGEVILTWSGGKFSEVMYDSTALPTPGWVLADDTTPAAPPSLPPGAGFFFFNPAATATNFTFVGQVVPGPSSSNSIPLTPGYNLVGSALPAAVTTITNTPVSLPVIDGMVLLQWNNGKYSEVMYDSTALPTPGWVLADDTTPAAAPPYAIGSGLFLFNPGATVQWTQSLP
jgi:hypothetical protein